MSRRLEIACEITGGILFFALLAAFCALCCACSDYHWA